MAGQPVQPPLIQFNSNTSVSLEDMQAQHTQLNETLTALQLRAQSPPVDVSERNAWATQVQEDSLALAKKYDDLAADAMEAAASGKPGAIDINAKANDSLESCATCHKLVDIALERWSAKQSFKLCEESELEAHKDKATVLDRSDYNSVSKAADDLQAGSTKCPEGYCIVFSNNASVYFVLYRSDKKEAAFDLFNFKEAEPELSWRESAGFAHGDDGCHFGDLPRSIAKHAKAGIKEGYEFGDLCLMPLARMFFGGHSSEVDAELEKKASTTSAASTTSRFSTTTPASTPSRAPAPSPCPSPSQSIFLSPSPLSSPRPSPSPTTGRCQGGRLLAGNVSETGGRQVSQSLAMKASQQSPQEVHRENTVDSRGIPMQVENLGQVAGARASGQSLVEAHIMSGEPGVPAAPPLQAAPAPATGGLPPSGMPGMPGMPGMSAMPEPGMPGMPPGMAPMPANLSFAPPPVAMVAMVSSATTAAAAAAPTPDLAFTSPAASRSTFKAGQRIKYLARSNNLWYSGVVVERLPNLRGWSIHLDCVHHKEVHDKDLWRLQLE